MKKLPHHFLFLTCLFVIPFFYCRKQVDIMPNQQRYVQETLPELSLRSSISSIAMSQSNANHVGIRFEWEYYGPAPTDGVYYALQFSAIDDQFTLPIEVPIGNSQAAGFSVDEFNQIACKLIEPGDAGDIMVRVKYMRKALYDQKVENGEEIYYSDMLLVKVSTYRELITYEKPNYLALPGNYQAWNPLLAPRLVTAPGMKEYEGYVHFPNEYPQLLMVRGNQWSDITFGHIGDGMFGVQGTPLSIFGGQGVYLIRASTNNNRWEYRKINEVSVRGSAVMASAAQNMKMTPAASNPCTWALTLDLMEGEFWFQLNNDRDLAMGNAWPANDKIPDYNAEGIRITKAGRYTLELDLSIPGNYLYHLHRLP